MDWTVKHNCLTPEQYQTLRDSAGWSRLPAASVDQGLKNELYSITIFDDDRLIGMGRVVGDGAIYFYIQDIVVLPAYQGRGIGTVIMQHVEAYLARYAGANAFIGLMSAVGASEFYKKFGYQARPEDGPGMYKSIPPKM